MNEMNELRIDVQHSQQRIKHYMQEHWRLFLFEGIVFILFGLAAILVPQFFSVIVVIFLGWLIVMTGAIHVARAFYFKEMPGFWSWLALGILQVTVGYLLIADPIAGVMTLTMMMALFFAFEGIVKTYMALNLRPLDHWQLVLASGISSLLFVVFILAFWKETAPWLLGVFMGINMIILGYYMVKMSLLHKEQQS